jgi:aspartyl protease family protein
MSDSEGPWGRAQAEARAQAQAASQAPGLSPGQSPGPPPPPGARPIGFYVWLGLLAAAGLGFWLMTALMPGRLKGSDWGNAARGLALLTVVSAGLANARTLKPLVAVRYAAIWVGIIGVLALGYAYRAELADAGQRLRAEIMPDQAVATTAHEMVIAQDAEGQYSIAGAVNGVPVRFIIDTGASDVVLTLEDARRIGIDQSSLVFSRPYSTANGVGMGADYKARTLSAGAVQFSNVAVSVNQGPMNTSLLGMTFLKRLESFEVKGGKMTLRWKG